MPDAAELPVGARSGSQALYRARDVADESLVGYATGDPHRRGRIIGRGTGRLARIQVRGHGVIAVDGEPPHELLGFPVIARHVVDPHDSAARFLGERRRAVGLDLVAAVAGDGDRFRADGVWAGRVHRCSFEAPFSAATQCGAHAARWGPAATNVSESRRGLRFARIRGAPSGGSDRDEWAGDLLVFDRLVRTRLGGGFAAGKREPQDRPLDGAELLAEPSAVVGKPITLADVLHLRRYLRVPAGRHIGEEVVLNLVAQVAGQHVEHGRALDVRRPEQLTNVEPAAGLVLDLLLTERVGLVGKVPTEDDRVGPDVADQVRGEVRFESSPEALRPRQQRERDVVLHDLPPGLVADTM